MTNDSFIDIQKLVLSLKRNLKTKKAATDMYSRGYKTVTSSIDQLNTTVTIEKIDDALEFWKSFLAKCEINKWKVGIDDHVTGYSYIERGSFIVVNNIKFYVSLRERTSRNKVKDKSHGYQNYYYSPSGLFVLTVLQYSFRKKEWTESNYTKFVNKIDDIILSIKNWAIELEEHEREAEAFRQKMAEERRLEELSEKRKEEEKAQLIELLHLAERWDKASKLRGFVKAKVDAMMKGGVSEEEIKRWEQWATNIVDNYDPLFK